MERKDQFLGFIDIARGVGDLVVDEARLVLRAVFRMPHQLASHGDHAFEHPLDIPLEPVTEMPTLFERVNRWDSEGRYTDNDGNEAA